MSRQRLIIKVLGLIRNRFSRKPEGMPQSYRNIHLWEMEVKPLGTTFGGAYIIDDEEVYLGRSIMKKYVLIKGTLVAGEKMQVYGSQDTSFNEESIDQTRKTYLEAAE